MGPAGRSKEAPKAPIMPHIRINNMNVLYELCGVYIVIKLISPF